MKVRMVPTLLMLDEDTRTMLKVLALILKERKIKSSTRVWGMAEAVRWLLRNWELLGGFGVMAAQEEDVKNEG